jgi:hypothetical protein
MGAIGGDARQFATLAKVCFLNETPGGTGLRLRNLRFVILRPRSSVEFSPPRPKPC